MNIYKHIKKGYIVKATETNIGFMQFKKPHKTHMTVLNKKIFDRTYKEVTNG